MERLRDCLDSFFHSALLHEAASFAFHEKPFGSFSKIQYIMKQTITWDVYYWVSEWIVLIYVCLELCVGWWRSRDAASAVSMRRRCCRLCVLRMKLQGKTGGMEQEPCIALHPHHRENNLAELQIKELRWFGSCLAAPKQHQSSPNIFGADE